MRKMGWHPLELGQPATVCLGYTTREGGVSASPWDSYNLGMHCGDRPEAVAENRRRLAEQAGVTPRWLRQVHGCAVAARPAAHADHELPEADAAWTDRPGEALAILTADCLPVLCWSESGDWVGVAHAGWRGLAAGVLPALLAAAPVPPGRLACWLGPAIGPQAYEVDQPVRAAFSHWSGPWQAAFQPARPGHWQLDLFALARLQLQQAGVGSIHGGNDCTFSQPERFFSYRRDGRTGRQAVMAWLQ